MRGSARRGGARCLTHFTFSLTNSNEKLRGKSWEAVPLFFPSIYKLTLKLALMRLPPLFCPSHPSLSKQHLPVGGHSLAVDPFGLHFSSVLGAFPALFDSG